MERMARYGRLTWIAALASAVGCSTSTDSEATDDARSDTSSDGTPNGDGVAAAEVDPSAACVDGQSSCLGDDLLLCVDSRWQNAATCPNGCRAGACQADCGCDTRVCGTDGCGSSCGTCAPDETCSFSGKCCTAAGDCRGTSEGKTCIAIAQCTWDADTCLKYPAGSTNYLACASVCADGASSDVKAVFRAVDDCETNCGNDGPCIWTNCMDELSACLWTESGTWACAEIDTCSHMCADGDDACVAGCWSKGTREGQAQLLGLIQCTNETCPEAPYTDACFWGGPCASYRQACGL